MKIRIDKNLVEFMPDTDKETVELERLWRLLIGCVSDGRKLSPVGEYVPSKKNTASFHIEGLAEENFRSAVDGVYYCGICNKMVTLKAADEIPLCCGQRMKSVD